MSEPTPGELTYWVIKFEDTDVPDLILTDETAARKSFKSHAEAWSCRLFCEVTDADARIAALENERDEAVEDLAFCGASRNEHGELVMQMQRYHAVHRCERHRDDPWQDIDTEIDCFVCLTQHLAEVTQERDIAKQNAQTVCGFLDGKDSIIASRDATITALQGQVDEFKRKYHEAMDIMCTWLSIDSSELAGQLVAAKQQLDIWKHSAEQNREIVDHKTGQINDLQAQLTQLQAAHTALVDYCDEWAKDYFNLQVTAMALFDLLDRRPWKTVIARQQFLDRIVPLDEVKPDDVEKLLDALRAQSKLVDQATEKGAR